MSDIAKIKTQQHKLPSINRAKYGKRGGLEGPFMTKSGQVVYYDHKKGQYLDPDKDMYLSYDDWKKLSEDFFAEARVLANNGQYKAVSSGGVVRIMYKGKEIASGDFDSGADGWFVSGKNDKGQKFFGDAQDMVDYFVKNKVTESRIMGLNKSSAEYKAGKEAAKKGIKYDANPHAPGVKRLNWSTGHNDFRADALRKAGKPNYGARGQFEEAPANATGTAVAGTGDDSSTVVVKKKKPMQDKLMRRMGIKEAIDRAVPDLEYEVDEITARANQLKEMALKEKTVPKDKETDQPKKYVAGLSDKDKKAHDRHLEKGSKKSDSDKSAYKQSPADKVAKTKTSVHTKKYKQMFGEGDVELNEVIKGLKKKAEKSGMPYSILKQVYNRGMAAWKGGHRPGTTPQQWAFARVNSFITKSSGTWGKADKDLAKKVRGS